MTTRSYMAVLLTGVTVAAILGAVLWRQKIPIPSEHHAKHLRAIDHDPRAVDWASEHYKAGVVTNVGVVDEHGTVWPTSLVDLDSGDWMIVTDYHQRTHLGYIRARREWISVVCPPLCPEKLTTDRRLENMFPQRDPSGTPVARALSAGGKKVTHVFTNGVWLEVGETANGIPTNTTHQRL